MKKQSTEPQRGFFCPHCQEKIATGLINRYTASRAGRVMSEARLEANRKNGAKGGRPKGAKDKRPRIRRSKKDLEAARPA